MSSVSLVGQDTIIINDRVFADLSNGNVGQIMFENDSANVMVGKDKNAIYAFNAQGVQATVELRVMRGSSDDKFLNNLYSQQCANFVGTTLLTGVFVKKIGDGSGQVENDSYSMSGGIFMRSVDVISNVEGEPEQGTSTWRLRFTEVVRSIG